MGCNCGRRRRPSVLSNHRTTPNDKPRNTSNSTSEPPQSTNTQDNKE